MLANNVANSESIYVPFVSAVIQRIEDMRDERGNQIALESFVAELESNPDLEGVVWGDIHAIHLYDAQTSPQPLQITRWESNDGTHFMVSKTERAGEDGELYLYGGYGVK